MIQSLKDMFLRWQGCTVWNFEHPGKMITLKKEDRIQELRVVRVVVKDGWAKLVKPFPPFVEIHNMDHVNALVAPENPNPPVCARNVKDEDDYATIAAQQESRIMELKASRIPRGRVQELRDRWDQKMQDEDLPADEREKYEHMEEAMHRLLQFDEERKEQQKEQDRLWTPDETRERLFEQAEDESEVEE